jgi:chromate reductase, NAD(P)H dehydrogenase (quinone)
MEEEVPMTIDVAKRDEAPPQPLRSDSLDDSSTGRASTRILAITGSLRARSSNTAVLQAAALLAPAGVRVSLFTRLDTLPHFNPDLDGEDMTPPPAVADFRLRVIRADALLICSPEYAHGVPGALKNALDWLVSVPQLPHKPVGLLNASPRAFHAHESLAETLRTMSLVLVDGATITLPLNGMHRDANSSATAVEVRTALRAALESLVEASRNSRRED